jgi:hypothetical protein
MVANFALSFNDGLYICKFGRPGDLLRTSKIEKRSKSQSTSSATHRFSCGGTTLGVEVSRI